MRAKPSFFIRFAPRASISWLRGFDRPPRRSLSNELLIARGTPPNLGGEFLLQAPQSTPLPPLDLPHGIDRPPLAFVIGAHQDLAYQPQGYQLNSTHDEKNGSKQ